MCQVVPTPSVVWGPSHCQHLSMMMSGRQFLTMKDFLEDLEVRSNVSSARSDSGAKKASKKHRLRSMFKTEERYASLVNGLK